MTYIVRNYQPEQDKDAVLAIIKDTCTEATMARYLEHYDWFQEYQQNIAPSFDGDVVVEKNGKVVGYARLIGTTYKLGGDVVTATHLSDNVTLAKYRGSGVKLFRYIVQVKERLDIGVPVARAGILWEKIAKRPVSIKKISRYVLMLQPSYFLKKKGVPLIFGGLINWLWKKNTGWKQKRISGIKSEIHLKMSFLPDRPTEQEYTALMSSFSEGFYAIALRNYQYFCWRFFNSPNTYQYIWLRDNKKLVGYCIYRDCLLDGRSLLLIVDIVAIKDQERVYQKMMSQLIDIAFEQKYSDIQLIETGCKALSRVLKMFGAIRKQEETNLLAYIDSNQPYSSEIYDNKTWYMSLADGDYEFVMYPYTRNNGE